MTYYLALIGDLVGSRTLPKRAALQRDMQEQLRHLNEVYANLFVSKLTLTLGDEFQGLLTPDRRVMQLVDDIEARIGTAVRIGLGYGTILTDIDPEISIGADGEAYWRAREALTWLKEKKAGERLRTAGFGAWEDELLNALFAVTDTIKQRWTTLQADTFRAMLATGIYSDNFRQVDFAESLGIRPSSLTKRLSAGDIKTYIHARLTAGKTMEVWHRDHK